MMKIGISFHTHDDCISGVEYYSLGLIRGLLSVDQDNEYVVYTNKPHLLKMRAGTFDNLTVRTCKHLKSRVQRICWEHFILPRLAKKDHLSLLHCPHYITPLLRCDVPYVVTVHDTFALDHPRWCRVANRLNYGLFMPRTSFQADAIIAVSQQTRHALLNYKTRSDPVVIYPGVEDCFTVEGDAGRHAEIRQKYKLPGRFLLYVGNIEPKKNLMNLLKAYRLLKSKQVGYTLVLVGKRSWLQEGLWEYLRSNFSSDEILLTGYADREDLAGIYRLADLCVFPSLSEGFGFGPLEAMRCGTAVAASRTGILTELPEESYCAVDPVNVLDIAEKICQMLGDSMQKRKQIGCALKESRQFSWEACARKTLALYRQTAA